MFSGQQEDSDSSYNKSSQFLAIESSINSVEIHNLQKFQNKN